MDDTEKLRAELRLANKKLAVAGTELLDYAYTKAELADTKTAHEELLSSLHEARVMRTRVETQLSRLEQEYKQLKHDHVAAIKEYNAARIQLLKEQAQIRAGTRKIKSLEDELACANAALRKLQDDIADMSVVDYSICYTIDIQSHSEQ